MTSIKRLRMQRLLTQKELAIMCGISPQQLCGYEKGKHKMTLLIAIKIANALGVPIEELIEGGPYEKESRLEQS